MGGALSFEVVATYPHDPSAFTQGLEVHDGVLYESVGQYGESERRIVDLATGTVLAKASLPDDAFGEGLTVVGDELYQLTWQNGVVFVADRSTLDEKRALALDTEGWGLCFNGALLVTSDGSSTLRFRQPADLQTIHSVTVTINGAELDNLNELECVGDVVFANVYQTSSIVMIDQASGTVTATLDLAALVPDVVGDAANDVLNGIAYRAETDTFLVTGKRWDTVYELRLASA
ncbi:MAG: glutaminyl-peptide cyclotransferase [Acidimicrobiales bacterium]